MLACFGDSCKDFDIIEDSDFAAELIKEGFTLEFMKNALIKPVLSLKNKGLLLDWWRQVEGGNPEAPLPAESEVFKSEHYSSFIFLYFKMATEVNVFSHLGQTLFAHMKESLFSDVVEVDSEDEEESNGQVQDDATSAQQTDSTSVENGDADTSHDIPVDSNGATEAAADQTTSQPDTETEPQKKSPSPPKTVRSMYGKVYTLKK